LILFDALIFGVYHGPLSYFLLSHVFKFEGGNELLLKGLLWGASDAGMRTGIVVLYTFMEGLLQVPGQTVI